MITLKIVDQRGSDLYVVLIMSFCILESKQMLSQTVLKLGIHMENLGNYMRLTCESELDIYRIKYQS